MSGHTTRVLSCWVCKCVWVCVRVYGCSKMQHLPCNGCFIQWRSCWRRVRGPRSLGLEEWGQSSVWGRGWIEGGLEEPFVSGCLPTHLLGFVYARKQLWKQRTLKPTSPENMECAQTGESLTLLSSLPWEMMKLRNPVAVVRRVGSVKRLILVLAIEGRALEACQAPWGPTGPRWPYLCFHSLREH